MSTISSSSTPTVAGSTESSPSSIDWFKEERALQPFQQRSSSSTVSSSGVEDDDEEDVPLSVLKRRYFLLSESSAKVGQGLGISIALPGVSLQQRAISTGNLQRKKSIHHLKGSKIRSGRRGAATLKIIECYFD